MTTTPNTTPEPTFTVTLTHNEMARVIGALKESAMSLRESASETGRDANYPTVLAEAAEQLVERLRDVLSPDRNDPNRVLTTDERIALEARCDR